MRQPNWLPLPLAQCGQGTFMPSVLRAHEMPKMLIQLEWAKVSPKVTQSWILKDIIARRIRGEGCPVENEQRVQSQENEREFGMMEQLKCLRHS